MRTRDAPTYDAPTYDAPTHDAPGVTSPFLWRIGTEAPSYRATDLSGKGAEITGGRWNRKGTPVVYLSTSAALACLETVVHLDAGNSLPVNRYLVRVGVPEEAWNARTICDAAACVGWDAEPAGMASHMWGEAWIVSGASLLTEVPSGIVPEERNVLLNPRHLDAARVDVTALRKWIYDARLVRRDGA